MTHIILLATLLAAGAPQRPAKRYTIEQFMAVTRATGASFSADESRVLFSSNESGIWNAYVVAVSGGKAQAVTRSKTDSTYAVSYFPHDDRFLVTHDRAGDEQNHLYLRTPDGKEKDLTPGAKLKAEFAGWSGDDKAFWVLTNERDPRFFDLYRYDAKTYARTLTYQNDKGLDVESVSEDGRYLALHKTNTEHDGDLYLYTVATKQTKHLTPHKGQVQFTGAEFDKEGKALYFLTDEGSEFQRVRRYGLEGGAFEDVEKADWDVMFVGFSKHGKYRVTGINEDARTVIRVVDTKTGAPLKLPPLPAGDLTGVSFSNSENKLALYLASSTEPANLYVVDLRTQKLTRLTDTQSKDIDPRDLAEAEVVRFKSFDGMEIPNVLYKPLDASEARKAPALVSVHGGPGGQTRRGYNAFVQYLVNHGYVVLGINNRGSSGYGKTFFAADDKKHGREPLWDCVAARKYLASLPYVDGSRVGIIGGSYGGYMTLAALAFQPDAFDVGVDFFGVSNWLRTLESIPPWWESGRQALYGEVGDPKTDAENLKAISPLFHADKIRKPLLVLQGANDPRVIQKESDEIVEAVKKNKVPVEYVVFPDEGHGFAKKKNEIRADETTLRFLDKYLKKEPQN